jgi:SAM-dependent methyltransferase
VKYFDFSQDLHRAYGAGRQLAPDVLGLWKQEIAELVEPATTERVIDLGAGTGRFSSALRTALQAEVIVVDPAPAMLAQAPADVVPIVGRAEALPLASGVCDLVFASMVLHHFSDLDTAAGEIRRVLRPGGSFLARTCFVETLNTPYHRFFPTVLEFERSVVPSMSEVLDAFDRAGLGLVEARQVRQRLDPDYRSYAERIRLRAMSPFRMIPDEEFEAGMSLLDEFAAAETDPVGVFEDIDLVLFG